MSEHTDRTEPSARENMQSNGLEEARLRPSGTHPLEAVSAARFPHWRADLALFLFAFALRAAAAVLKPSLRGYAYEWGDIAQSILAGHGFVFPFYGTTIPFHAFFPPFYPYLLAAARAVFGGAWPVPLMLLQSGVAALGVMWTRRLAVHWVGERLGTAAGWITAVWPPLVVYSLKSTPAFFDAAMVPLILLLLVRVTKRPTAGRAAAAGVATGALAYSLPSFLGALVLMPFAFRATGMSRRRALALPAVALVAALAVIAPWTARNVALLHRPVLVSTNLGFNLAGSNNPDAVLGYNVFAPHDAIRARYTDARILAAGNEVDLDHDYLRQAVRYMAGHPVVTGKRMAARSLYFWWVNPLLVRYDRAHGIGAMILMSALLPLFLVGLVVTWRRRRGAVPVAVAALVWMNLVYMNMAARGRYGLTVQPVMILFAVAGLAWMWSKISPRRSPNS